MFQNFSLHDRGDVKLVNKQMLVSFVLKKQPKVDPQHIFDPKQVPSPPGPHLTHFKQIVINLNQIGRKNMLIIMLPDDAVPVFFDPIHRKQMMTQIND